MSALQDGIRRVNAAPALVLGVWALTLLVSVPLAVALRGMRVSAGYLDLLGARMQLGRSFTLDDQTPAGGEALILTDAAWRDLFGADPHPIVGTDIARDDRVVV